VGGANGGAGDSAVGGDAGANGGVGAVAGSMAGSVNVGGSSGASAGRGSTGAAGVDGASGSSGAAGANGGEGAASGATAGSAGAGAPPIVLTPPILRCPGGEGGAGGNADSATGGGAVVSAGADAGGAPALFALGDAGAAGHAQGGGAGFTFVTTDLGNGVPVAINQPGQVIAVVEQTAGSVRACRSFLVDDAGVREISVPGSDTCTRATALNDDGYVVGSAGTPPEPFLWYDGGTMFLSEVSGTPVAINNANQVALDSAVLWDAGQVTELTLPGGGSLVPVAMNNAGQIVGTAGEPEDVAYLWQNGSAVALPLRWPKDINDQGHVLGVSGGVGIWNGTEFLFHASTLDADPKRPMGLNNADELAGTRDESPGDWPPYPFAGTVSHFTQIEDAGEAYDINDRGDVIGRALTVRRFGSGPNASLEIRPGPGRIWSRQCSLACCR
jgi:hypothetical protein